MINIRHHIASIIAIFLALAIGLVIGSTFISGETVDVLEARLDAQEADLDDTQGESDSLQVELDELQAFQERFETAAPAHVFHGRLSGESAMVLTASGTKTESIDRALESISATESVAVGVMTIDAVISAETIADFQAALDQLAPIPTTTSSTVPPSSTVAPTTTADPTPDQLPTLEELAEFLAASTSTTNAPTTTTVAVPTTQPDESAVVLQSLLSAGLASFVGAEVDVPRASRLLVVFDAGSDTDIAMSMIQLVEAINAGEQPRAVVVADAAAHPAVAAIRADIELALVIPTVSHVDRVVGQLAAILALEDLSVPFVEHYGSEEGFLLLPPGEL